MSCTWGEELKWRHSQISAYDSSPERWPSALSDTNLILIWYRSRDLSPLHCEDQAFSHELWLFLKTAPRMGLIQFSGLMCVNKKKNTFCQPVIYHVLQCESFCHNSLFFVKPLSFNPWPHQVNREFCIFASPAADLCDYWTPVQNDTTRKKLLLFPPTRQPLKSDLCPQCFLMVLHASVIKLLF